jgi:hypothetical protein
VLFDALSILRLSAFPDGSSDGYLYAFDNNDEMLIGNIPHGKTGKMATSPILLTDLRQVDMD